MFRFLLNSIKMITNNSNTSDNLAVDFRYIALHLSKFLCRSIQVISFDMRQYLDDLHRIAVRAVTGRES